MGADLPELIAPYEQLVAIAEREREALAREAWEDLAAIAHAREELVRSLPPAAPPEARPLLERAAELQQSITRELQETGYATALELRRVQRGIPALRRYAPPPDAPGSINAEV